MESKIVGLDHKYKKYTVHDKVVLNQIEKEIFQIFTDFLKEKNLKTTIRVAGGWVRDKLLGKESIDLDFAIDDMTGEEFVRLALDSIKEKTEVHGFGVTKFNPEKSKHLETAKIQVKGIWLDIVNLRGEVYDENSRIPQIKIGTPEEDALRRDLTINALFYNVNTGEVEDFTAKGIEDLKEGIVRTPIDPIKTFEDDPLRILRVIRFASRYGFMFVPEIPEALKNKKILEGLRTKVSKERIGVELNLMLYHVSAFQSILYYHKLDLMPHIIEISERVKELADFETIKKHFHLSYIFCEKCHLLLETQGKIKNLNSLERIYPDFDKDKSQLRYYTYLSMIMAPFEQYKIETKPKKFEQLVSYMMRESIKTTNKDSDIISLVIANRAKFSELVNTRETSKTIIRDTAKTIKEMGSPYGPIWELSLNLALIYDIVMYNDNTKIQKIINDYELFYKFVYDNKLEAIYELKAFIDGKDTIQLFQLKQGGPMIKKILDNILYWQIENPKANKNDLLNEIQQNKEQFMN